MRITYRHQYPAMQYGVAEFTLEADVPSSEALEAMQNMQAMAETVLPWPGRPRATAPHNDPATAEPRPSQAQIQRLVQLSVDLEKATGAPVHALDVQSAAQAEDAIHELEAVLASAAKRAPGAVPAPQVTHGDEAPTDKQLALLRTLASHFKRATGEPAMVPGPDGASIPVPRPKTRRQASDWIDQLQAALKGIEGHAVDAYTQGRETPAGQRTCSHQAHTPRHPEPLTIQEWDWSIARHGKPLCRDHQREA